METFAVRQGTAVSLAVTIANEAGPLAYLGTEPLAATLWAGDDQSSLATLSPAWKDASQGVVEVTVPESVTTSLEPAAYLLSLTVSTGGQTYEAWRAWIRVESGPGSAVKPVVWCSYDDMLLLASWLDDLQGASDTAGFLEHRARATEWAIEQGMSRARDMLESQYQRHAPILGPTTPATAIPAEGVDLGPAWGDSSYWSPQLLADLNQWRDWFHDPAVVVVDSRISEIVARFAVSLVCAQQIGQAGDTSYQALAARFRRTAIQLTAGYSWRFLTPDDEAHPERRLD